MRLLETSLGVVALLILSPAITGCHRLSDRLSPAVTAVTGCHPHTLPMAPGGGRVRETERGRQGGREAGRQGGRGTG